MRSLPPSTLGIVTAPLGFGEIAGTVKDTPIPSVIVIPFAIGNVKNRISFVYSVNILRSTLKYSIPIFIAVSFSWMLNMTDRLFIANLSTLQEAGVYSLASKFTQFAVLLVGAVHQAYSPFFYNISNTNTYEETYYGFLEKKTVYKVEDYE